MGIKTESIENGDKRRVLEDYTYPDGVTVPKGFICNGASTPRMFWFIVPPFKHPTCFVRHDWDCERARFEMNEAKVWFERGHAKLADMWTIRAIKTRKEGDSRYRKCKSVRDNKLIGWLAWAGVRVGSFIGKGW